MPQNYDNQIRLGATGAGLLSAILMASIAESGIGSLRQRSNSQHRPSGIAREMGAPAGIPFTSDSSGLAYFMPKEVAGLSNRVQSLFGSPATAQDRRREKYGEVNVSEGMDKPAVVAHEMGHAVIGNRPWSAPSRINQSVLRPATSILAPIISMLGGVPLGQQVAKLRTPGGPAANTALAGLAGGAMGAAVNLPTLYSEWEATALAKDWLKNKSGLPEDEQGRSRSALNKALATYLAAATVVPALSSGAAAYFARK